MLRMVGRRAVEQDPRPHPVVGRRKKALADAQGGGAVADRARPRQLGGGGGEGGERALEVGAVGGVGVRQVRHQGDLADLRQGVETKPRGAIRCRREAEPVHAAVELEEDLVRQRRLVRGQPVDLRLVVDGVPEIETRAGVEVAGIEAALEEQDRAAPAELAQQGRFLRIEQGEPVGALQAGVHVADAVAVGVGLDDRPDLGAAGGAASHREVGREGLRMDERFDRSRHRRILPATNRRRLPRGVTKTRVL